MANLGFINIVAWANEQVVEWFKGFDDVLQPYVENVLEAGLTGKRLLYLTHSDLAKMQIHKLGHQEMILEAVDLLRSLHFELESENTQSFALKLSCKASSLRCEVLMLENNDFFSNGYYGMMGRYESNRGKFPLQTLTSVSSMVGSIKTLVAWLDRPPFDHSDEWIKKRNKICEQGSYLVAAAQGDNIPKTREDIITACEALKEVCDKIVQESRDPLVLQPALLEVATIKKKPGEELGMHIQALNFGVHVVEGIKEQSAAEHCGKVEEGDVVVQVNYQTVVGWTLKKLVAVLKENQKEVTLTLKKRPRHAPIFGPTPRKRRSSSKLKQSTFPKAIRTRSKKGDRASRSPLTEFLNVSETLPPPSQPFCESYNVQDVDTDEGEVFQGASLVEDYSLDGKQRRATVSGGSPTIQRSSLRQRPKSHIPISPSSPAGKSDTSTGKSDTSASDGVTSPDAKTATPDAKLSPTEEMRTEMNRIRAEAGLPIKGHHRKTSDLAAKEIAGEARGSPRLVRITRIDSTRRALDYSGNKDASDSDASLSEDKPPSMSGNSYVVNIVGGVPQRVPASPDLRNPMTPGNQSLLRASRKNITRRVGANRRISCKDLGHGDCQGWLWKKREDVSMLASKWVKRWCILKRNNLYYYKDKEDDKAQGVVYLPGFKISPAPELKSRKFAFKAHHSGTTFYFASERQDDMGKWMNKMGLAAIVFDTSTLTTTAGFKKPERVEPPILEHTGYYSESDDEDEKSLSAGDNTSLSVHWTMTPPATNQSVEIRQNSKAQTNPYDEDWGKVYSQIQEAELNLDGINKRRRRTSMLARSQHLDCRSSQELQISRKLLSLERTLKDKEKELSQIEKLLSHPVTRELLNDFKENNLSIIEHINAVHLDSSTTQSEEDTETEERNTGTSKDNHSKSMDSDKSVNMSSSSSVSSMGQYGTS